MPSGLIPGVLEYRNGDKFKGFFKDGDRRDNEGIMEYANGADLAVLLNVRKQLTQREVSLILRQVVRGLIEIWQLHMIHRDMKLANILLNFPDNPEVTQMTRQQKKQFLANCDLTKIKFEAKISDFGLSTILESSTS